MIGRVLVGVIGAPIFLALLIRGGTALTVVCAAIAAAGVFEYSRMSSLSRSPALTAGSAVLAAAFVADSALGGRNLALLVWACVGVPLLMHVLAGTAERAMQRAAEAAFVPVYTGFALSRFVLLRFAQGPGEAAAGTGLALFVVIVIWMCDIGAFATGITLGRHKLSPRLSPKKSVEGCIGGFVWAAAGAAAFKALGDSTGLWYTLAWPLTLTSSLLIAAAGQLGDLAESALKRDAGVKDSGCIFPGHGGVLDRFDSLVFAAPAAYYLFERALPHLFGR
ncbi:MAG: Phosphatidate cytidylyltransferase [Firmicutes bacterium ADurb.Bin506]|jgi:phosphatidate cytidylyltransferase|nr:MAG: Phosphatidate cytidylyltransferase [Firmicutes bacterium ADurb.Bin506]